MTFIPSYKKISKDKLEKKIQTLEEILTCCNLCPRNCRGNRIKGQKGYCRADANLFVSSYGAHFGEENILVENYGSGTIFLTWCNLRCVFCQNYDISLYGLGDKISIERCAEIMLWLQKKGCHNINFVTPTHYVPQLVKSIKIASEKGLNIPVVWNCGGYENVQTIKYLKGIVDIYMPDIKYSRFDTAALLSNAPDYFDRCKEAVKEMFEQVGNIQLENGIAKRGLLIRHLVLPENLAGSEEVLLFIKNEISSETYVNIMAQYRPYGVIPEKINRCITPEEYLYVVNLAKKIGLKNIIVNKFF